MFEKHPKLSVYEGLEFPAQLPEDYFEPIGIEYGRYKDWKDVQMVLDTHCQLPRDRCSSSPVQPEEETAQEPKMTAFQDNQPVRSAAFPDVLQIQPMAAANNGSPTNNVATSMSPAVASPSQGEKWDYGPQNNWSRNLSPMTAYRVSVASTYLSENVKFAPLQSEYFWKAVKDATNYHGGEQANSENIAGTIFDLWMAKHYQLIAEGISIGLGGLIRTNHVKRILRSKGNEIRAAQSGGNNPHPKART
jgi:hypothetical protein